MNKTSRSAAEPVSALAQMRLLWRTMRSKQ